MALLLGFAFISGLVTILAPCIWPLLPIILSSSVAGGQTSHHKPLGITLGIMLSFAVVTLAISTLVKLLHFDPNVLRLFAVIVIGFLGLTMVIPPLSQFTEGLISRLVGLFGRSGQTQRSGFGGGFITGLSLGIVWSPCAGPILAAIATLAATGQVTLSVVLVTIAYVCGIGIPLFIFAYGGQQILARTKAIASHTGRIQQVFGILMLLTALAIYTNYDKYLQAQFLNAFPQISSGLTNIEKNDAVTQQLNILKGATQTTPHLSVDSDNGLFNTNTPAPDFMGITHWLNVPDGSTPPTIKSVRGKVVLVDFWTYTCINCIRTLPFTTSWYEKYKDQGFVLIGVHTPEFEFEKDTTDVAQAIKMYKITYPVAQDNNYATWNTYGNQYWPAEYLIDAKGIIRRTHFGEGEYDQTEKAIQELLKEAGKNVTTKLSSMSDQTPQSEISPETYLGSQRMQYYYPDGSLDNGKQTFMLTDTPPVNSFSYGGEWTINDDDAVAGKKASLSYTFTASKVFIILRPMGNKNPKVKVTLDNKQLTSDNSGADVQNGEITIDQDRLYNILDFHGKTETHTLRLDFETPGTAAFTFTFG
ncbi:MAG TPA: cytochrome c biogenesis protein DipZ [Patescibacteria group bacterium]|nr:cytochrome c biogenesis protein DipZ [Patescibacteria group bacterium]